MTWDEFVRMYGQASKTGLGFFWKSGWAFVLGYFVSAMIQAFVPKARLTQYMGDGKPKSIGLASAFGAISSSCSFAALATARALVLKGARFVEAVAFMFASTNLVIELGILIVIFLGWEFLIAEIIGGVVLIAISSVLIKLMTPDEWFDEARQKVEAEAGDIAEDFDWKERITSKEGWLMVGEHFVSEWKMVWEEILIGFSVAGIVAVFVPTDVWEAIFLVGAGDSISPTLVAVENALVGPFVAMATFIGSMGNIPLATVLSANGVMFAGIMAFIYSDLVVPPLVMVNKRYYGWKVALFIAGIMYVSMVATAMALWAGFQWVGATPETQRVVHEVTQFAIDYTFWFNLVFVFVAGWLIWMNWRKKHQQDAAGGHDHGDDEGSSISFKRVVALTFAAIDIGGLVVYAFVG